eukprot:GHVR01174774.1.p1 GENE.GHVR01174774.1~~GHVR01174774.1.p1  ORF type:complete len:250 (+),score=58.12 GHVR01174774.1:94-750(+)
MELLKKQRAEAYKENLYVQREKHIEQIKMNSIAYRISADMKAAAHHQKQIWQVRHQQLKEKLLGKVQKLAEAPGPGAYEHEFSSHHPGLNFPCWGMHKKIRNNDKRQIHDVPGPGHYVELNPFRDQRAPKIIQSLNTDDGPSFIPKGHEDEPGPGHYAPCVAGANPLGLHPKVTIAYKTDGPGPGEYDVGGTVTVNKIKEPVAVVKQLRDELRSHINN